jgi:hypothetical protein
MLPNMVMGCETSPARTGTACVSGPLVVEKKKMTRQRHLQQEEEEEGEFR